MSFLSAFFFNIFAAEFAATTADISFSQTAFVTSCGVAPLVPSLIMQSLITVHPAPLLSIRLHMPRTIIVPDVHDGSNSTSPERISIDALPPTLKLEIAIDPT